SSVFAEEANSESDFVVELTSDMDGAKIVKYKGKSPNVIIPDMIQGLPVLEVGDFFCGLNGMKKNKTIKRIVFPDSVREIGGLSGYEALESVVLPASLKKISCASISIGKTTGMFEGCKSLKFINLPASVKRIEKDAFKGCSSLTDIEIPEELTECDIAETAFKGTNIILITQSKLRKIGYRGRF
nr:leucine-rich repeat domain-containing protein [Treponema sp.]